MCPAPLSAGINRARDRDPGHTIGPCVSGLFICTASFVGIKMVAKRQRNLQDH